MPSRRLLPFLAANLLACTTSVIGSAPEQKPPPRPLAGRWVQRSNQHAQALLHAMSRQLPELATRFGVNYMDDQVIDLKPGFTDRARADLKKAIATLETVLPGERDSQVRQDLQIMIEAGKRKIKELDLEQKHLIPSLDLAQLIFFGVRGLLEEQAPPERRRMALIRLRRYTGVDPGYEPITVLAEAYTRERLRQPGLVGPYRGEIEKRLAQTHYFVDGIDKLCAKYRLPGYEALLEKLKAQLAAYDEFTRREVLPKANPDFRLPPPIYALRLEQSGIDSPPEELIAMGRHAFAEIQQAMERLAPKVAAAKGIQATGYREVIRALKAGQLEGDALMKLYRRRIAEIERIIRDHQLVTLPERAMIFRFASQAESAATPMPHLDIPTLLNNTGQRGAFLLPLKIPPALGQKHEQRLDDFTFDAASWTLTAHEGRPGHELQFDTMVERGVSIARVVFALNSTNAEGWGLYSEWLLYPFMPDDGKLISLQHRLMRAARAFLDPELQTGKTTPDQAKAILQKDGVLSEALASEEMDRYMFWSPGQAPSYYYGYVQLLAIRQQAERAMAAKFDQRKLHDFILDQGLMPLTLLRRVVLEELIPSRETRP